MRLEFARTGIASVLGGALRIHELDGRLRTTPQVDHPVLDARWPGGQIVAFDRDARLVWYDGRGGRADERALGWGLESAQARTGVGRFPAVSASLSANAHRIAVLTQFDLLILAATGERLWVLGGNQVKGIAYDTFARATAELSDDGKRCTLAYDGTWIELDIATKQPLTRGDTPRPLATIDASGLLVATIHAEAPRIHIAFRDLRTTIALDSALPDIVALAFAPDSRSLAVLASDGRVEVVIVP